MTVSDWDTYWDKLQTGIAGGDAPDVFAMDGPLFPDYQSRDVLLDLKPYIDKSGYDLSQLADQAVGDFTTPGGQFGLPRDLNVIALYYNKKMFDAAKIPYPDDTWDWAKLVEVGKKLTLKGSNGKVSQWGFYTETTDMENYWGSLIWQNGGDIISADHKQSLVGSDQAVGALQFFQDIIYKDKIMAIPVADAGDGFEAGPGRHGGERLVARGHPPRRQDRLRHRAVAQGPGRPVHLGQPDRRRRLQGDQEPGRGLGVREVPGQPGGADQDHGAQGVAAGQQVRADRPVRRPRSTEPRSSPTPSPTRRSSRRSRASTNGRPRSRTSSTRTSTTTRTRRPRAGRRHRAEEARRHPREPVTGRDRADRADRPMTSIRRPASRRGGPLAGETRWALLFLAPTLIGLAILSAGPIVATLGISLTKWDLLTAPKFIGPDNYTALVNDDRFHEALRNTFFYTATSVPIGLVLALGLALALNQKIRGIAWIRTAYFLPVVTSTIAIALVWQWIYAPDQGLLNEGIGLFGIPRPAMAEQPDARDARHRGDVRVAGPGVNVIIFLAGLQAIPEELLDAASVDGAGPWSRFRGVVLPLLTPSIFFTGVLALIDSFQVFDQIFVLERPRATDATVTVVYFIYENGFKFFKMGYASAASWVLFLIVAAFTAIYFRLQGRWVHYQ